MTLVFGVFCNIPERKKPTPIPKNNAIRVTIIVVLPLLLLLTTSSSDEIEVLDALSKDTEGMDDILFSIINEFEQGHFALFPI